MSTSSRWRESRGSWALTRARGARAHVVDVIEADTTERVVADPRNKNARGAQGAAIKYLGSSWIEPRRP